MSRVGSKRESGNGIPKKDSEPRVVEEIGEKESTRMNCLTIVIAYTRPQELSRENTQDVRM